MKTTRREFQFGLSAAAAAGALGAWPRVMPEAGAQDAFTRETKDFVDVAEPVAAEAATAVGARIRQRFAADPNARPFRIAVFPFGGDDGKVTLDSHELAFHAQGALASALGHKLAEDYKGQFVMLDKFAVSRELADAGIDAASVSAANPELPAALAKAKIDLAVLGTTAYGNEGTELRPKLVFAGEGAQGNVVVPKPSPGSDEYAGARGSYVNTKRLGVQLWLKLPQGYQQAPIYSAGIDSEYFGMLCAIVPRNSEGTEFAVRISNSGAEADRGGRGFLGIQNENRTLDARRLFGVVLSIDGVNCFYEDMGDGELKPAIVHPRKAKKWVLTPPGYRVAPANNARGYDLERSAGVGNSVMDVKGFQVDNQHARAFTLAAASDSLAAEKLGITSEVGVITVTFYAEKLRGDVIARASRGNVAMGTAAGRQMVQPVFTIKPKFHKEPVLTMRIFYRTPENCPIPPAERLLVSGR